MVDSTRWGCSKDLEGIEVETNFLIKLFYVGMFLFPWLFLVFMCLLGERENKQREFRHEHSVYGCGVLMKRDLMTEEEKEAHRDRMWW
jgi:hypothetical protein